MIDKKTKNRIEDVLTKYKIRETNLSELDMKEMMERLDILEKLDNISVQIKKLSDQKKN
jgi:hypothetical protein